MKLFYRQYGKGEPVIILHGLFGLSDNWVSIGRKLSEKFSVYIVDLRNHGQSPHSLAFNYLVMVEDIKQFIEEHQLNSPIIIGHSMGGKVAMQYSLNYPYSVSKLVVVDISMRKYQERQYHIDMINAMQQIDFSEVKTRDDIDEMLNKSIKSKSVRLFIMKNLERIDQSTFSWRLNLNDIYENLDYIFEGVESQNSFQKPTLFIKGGNSDYIEESDIPKIEKHFPNYTLKVIDNATHWVHSDAPEELCAILSNFMGNKCEFSN